VGCEEFKARHRTEARYFSRERVLSFKVVLMMMLSKGAKGLQLMLNEVLGKLGVGPVSKSAYSQARRHLKHTAFIELNQKAIVDVTYQDDQYQRYWGYRVLGIDGSKIILPDSDSIYDSFGKIKQTSGQKGGEVIGYYSYGLASVLYDVLNEIAIDSVLADSRAYEVDLAEGHLAYTQADDLLLCDRNYPSYRWLATLVKQNRHFVIRCGRNSFAPVRAMFGGKGVDSRQVTLNPHSSKRADIRRRALPLQLTVRLVRLTLPNGDIEVLVTDLLDESRYPTDEFGPLYRRRWGIETFFGRLKSRLLLENFSGFSPEVVRQDFFATIFITGLESLLTDTAKAQLQARSQQTQHLYQVNRAVSFNAVKNHVLELLYSDTDLDTLLPQLTRLFLTAPSCTRHARFVPRQKRSARRLLNFHRRFKKICF
jgi:hypothetical protein